MKNISRISHSRGRFRRSRSASIVAGLVSLLMLAVFVPPASADEKVESGHVYRSDGPCTWGRAELSHGNGGGRSEASVAQDDVLDTPWGSYSCDWKWADQGPYRMKVAYDLYKWSSSTASWNVCRYTNWYYNPERMHKYEIYSLFGNWPDCGKGYYMTVSWSYTLNGGDWNGGWLATEYHWLPA